MTSEERIARALEIAASTGGVDGAHHKMWTIDQMVRALTGCPVVQRQGTDWRGTPYTYEAFGESDEYLEFVREHNSGEDGPDTYEWDSGTAP